MEKTVIMKMMLVTPDVLFFAAGPGLANLRSLAYSLVESYSATVVYFTPHFQGSWWRATDLLQENNSVLN